MILTKRSINLCLMLVMASSGILAQTAKTPPINADEMRAYQLRVFRQHVLARTLDNIKKMDEAGLRVSARNQLLAYLASENPPSNEKQALATQIARDALTDIREHNDEIEPFM